MSGELSRRDALSVALLGGGAFVLGFSLPACGGGRAVMADEAARSGQFVPNAWIKVLPDGAVHFTLDRVEMGQGTTTSHVMMVAEELEVAPESIVVERADADRHYDNPELGFQITGGSTSVKASFLPLRKAAAAAREMLIGAAADSWGVPSSQCNAEGGVVVHIPSGRKAPYGTLTKLAAQRPIPNVAPKPREQCKLLGKGLNRVDTRPRVDGSGVYGIDVKVPGMLTAVILRPPAVGQKVHSVRDGAARKSPGVTHVVTLRGGGDATGGVAVVADTYWHARKGAEALLADSAVDFGPEPEDAPDSVAIGKELAERARGAGKPARLEGDFARAFGKAAKTVEAVYEAPHLAHATMEPMNCTAHVTEDRCEVWAPTQAPGLAREVAAHVAGMSRGQVQIHTTLLGGGFGRRLVQDFVAEAVELSKAIGKPVKVVWSREDDQAHDFYRPRSHHVLKGAVDAAGHPTAWFHRIVGPSIVSHVAGQWFYAMAPPWMPTFMAGLLGSSAAATFSSNVMSDDTSVEGAADLPYAIEHLRVDYREHDPGVPVGFWRGVGHSHNAFVTESFIDELAHLAGKDPYLFRRQLLGKAPRHLGVLDLAARKAGWHGPREKGLGRGIAVHEAFDSFCAQVADVSVEKGVIRVHRVVCALDCGFVVNPDVVAAQVESAVAFGLSAALKQEITLKAGRVEQTNFHTFPVLRMHEMPKVEVHLVDSREPPTGVGEPGLPPIAPAVANAIFALTGKRLRRTPLEAAWKAAT